MSLRFSACGELLVLVEVFAACQCAVPESYNKLCTVILSEAKDLCSWNAQVHRSFASLKMTLVSREFTRHETSAG